MNSVMKRSKFAHVEVNASRGAFQFRLLKELLDFKQRSDLSIANRNNAELEDVPDKDYHYDFLGRDAWWRSRCGRWRNNI